MIVYVFVLGLLMGSFFNVCIYRIPQGKSVISPPSACGHCHTRLGPVDLIPLISYIVNRGKCRHCKTKYSSRYAWVELLTGVMYAVTFYHFAYSIETIVGIILTSILIIVTFIDIDHKLIFDRFSLIVIGLSIPYHMLWGQVSWLNVALGFLIGGGLLFLLALLGAMGGGDIKIMASFGFFLGFPWIGMALYLSFIVGGLVSLLYLILFKILKKETSRVIPFGPYLCIGVWLTYYFGDAIYAWYQNMFLLA